MTKTSSSANPAPESNAGVGNRSKLRVYTADSDSQAPDHREDGDGGNTPQNEGQMTAFESRYLRVSPYQQDNGSLIGRDPREIATADLKALGHPPNFKKAVRMKCLDCVGTVDEIRKCVQFSCPLWHMRMGNNPLHGKGGA